MSMISTFKTTKGPCWNFFERFAVIPISRTAGVIFSRRFEAKELMIVSSETSLLAAELAALAKKPPLLKPVLAVTYRVL